MHAPVHLPASLNWFRTLGPLISVTDGRQAVCRYPERLDVCACGGGSTVTESEVVLRRTALVAMALQNDVRGRKIRENRVQGLSVFRQGGPGIVTDAALGVIKIDIDKFRRYAILERLGVEERWRGDWQRQRQDK